MNINKHNYEEFFLLYTDDELSEEQKTDVELFVQQHPELAEEFEMLQQAKLSPDESLVFDDKEALLNIAKNHIDLNNYEEYFLLKLDKELSKEEEDQVDQFIAYHPKLKKEYSILQQTKLPLEIIEFPDKRSLYRSEEKERRVIAFRFSKLAVAAAVLGLTVLIWWIVPTEKHTDVAAIKPVQNEVLKEPQTPPSLQQQDSKDEVAVVPESRPKTKESSEATHIPKHNQLQENIQAVKQDRSETAIQNKQRNKNNLPELNSGVNELQQQNPQNVTAQNPLRSDNPVAAVKPLEEINKEQIKNETASYVANTKNALTQPAVYKEINTDDDNETVYVGSMQFNKTKVKGLLKKATRLFGNKVKDEDDDGKLQVASFELDTRKSK